MKILDVEQGTDEWKDLRKGKISGTMLGDLYSKRGGRKIGFYEIIADRLGLGRGDEDRMQRGLDLEEEALEILSSKTGLEFERLGICVSDFSDQVINSPDALAKIDGKYKTGAEIKCLSPARHLQAVIENKIPAEFESQTIQYFIVNDDLETLYFIFYDPSIPTVPFHEIVVKREDIVDKIEMFKNYQIETLIEIDAIIESLTF